MEGIVVIQSFIDKKGRVTVTVVLQGIPNSGLDEAAAETVRKTRFYPAKKWDQEIGVWMSISVNFKLAN